MAVMLSEAKHLALGTYEDEILRPGLRMTLRDSLRGRVDSELMPVNEDY
jgi:hypothetical protein